MSIQRGERGGFTIVELLIVVVVIAILAVIVTVAYNGISRSAAQSALKSDIQQAIKSLEVQKIQSGSYPAEGSAVSFKGDTIGEYTSDGTAYCLTVSSNRAQTSYYVSSANTAVTEGACPSHTGYDSTSGAGSIALAPMPVGNIPGWNQTYTQDFSTPAALGSVGTVYGANMRGYSGFADTSGHGTYTPDSVLSVVDGKLDYYLHTEGGTPRVAAPVPMGYAGQTYGRYSVKLRTDMMDGYKIAFLLWPTSDQWSDGEIDWPEGNLGKRMFAHSAMVGSYNNGSMSFDPSNYGSVTGSTDWHIATIEWLPGVVKFYWDNAFVTQTSVPSGVPTTNMRWTLQAETATEGAAPAATVAGHLQVDWIVAYSYNGGVAVTTPLSNLQDDFSKLSSSKWSVYQPLNVSTTPGTVRLTANSTYPTIRSKERYVFTNSSISFKPTMPSSSNSAIQVRMGAYKDEVNYVRFSYVPGWLSMVESVNGASNETGVTYNATQHAWLRIREASGTTYWEASSNDSSWTTLRSKATSSGFSEVTAVMQAGNWNNVQSPGYLEIDSVSSP